METKKCYRCGRELPVTEFHKCHQNADGLYSYCKDCKREENAKYRALHPRVSGVTAPPVSTIAKDNTGNPVVLMDRFTTSQLLDELRKRGCNMVRKPTPREMMVALHEAGFTGKLQYTKVETVDIAAL